ncbi:hypothetical protein ACWJJH_18675 [Endozoicomonadaceae bacterium StTr2]
MSNFIESGLEKNIRLLANQHGFVDTPLRSKGTHQIELSFSRQGMTEYVYIDRKKGLSKGLLHVVVRPEVSEALAASFRNIDAVQQHMNAKDPGNPVIQSSQYKGFNNKQASGGEHRGHGWKMPFHDSLETLDQFLGVLVICENS